MIIRRKKKFPKRDVKCCRIRYFCIVLILCCFHVGHDSAWSQNLLNRGASDLTINYSAPAAGTLSIIQENGVNVADVNVTAIHGSTAYYPYLVYRGVPIEPGREYEFQARIRADQTRKLVMYVQSTSTWNKLHVPLYFQIGTDYSVVTLRFIASEGDHAARMVIANFGEVSGHVWIKDLSLTPLDGTGAIDPTPTPHGSAYSSPTPTPTPTHHPVTQHRGNRITIQIPNLPAGSVPLEMVFIPAGTFMMGAYPGEYDSYSDELPYHKVTITQDFYMGVYEVTQAQWQTVMGSNPSTFNDNPNKPVETISWYDAQEFIRKLNTLEQGTFRLPTEAEWELACRAGTRTRFFWGEDSDYSESGKYGWSSANNSPYGTKIVGQLLPNPYGLYDICGNVFEWCQDWFSPSYPADPQVNPTGPASGTYKTDRGGYWRYHAKFMRAGHRGYNPPEGRYDRLGLRLVRNVQ